MKLQLTVLLVLFSLVAFVTAQTSTDYINQFEPIENTEEFDGVKVGIGGSFALQFQGLDHQNDAIFIDDGSGANSNELIDLANNFNLATANLDVNVFLGKGLKAHLRTYMSSRHHHEPYVKGGYFQIDGLDFIKEGLFSSVMDHVTIKVGHMENNYGDAHLRRSDNAQAFYNPFVGNLLMDGFTTEVGGEIYYVNKESGIIAMLGASNGKLNQDVKDPGENGVAILGKLGVDRQLNKDLRLRLTGSMYSIGNAERIYLYSADRTGSRYYSVMETVTDSRDDFRSGRINPGFADKITAFMINPFVKFKGLEFFGTYELASGGDVADSDETRDWTQLAGEMLYRFGGDSQFYLGGRYNTVSGKLLNADAFEVSVNRLQGGVGWYLNKNILAKMEYVMQSYKDYPVENKLCDGEFSGVMVESVIAF